ncbi:hypothetical protein [Candidatus Chloroploca asiatica]|uniref:Uncharacterized protein n=1 Tax=Candidatus Chloroploca asiatica TaxID=1506545 RepID=A0A2H3KL60_9CHLR|nr:hypothetical protein [Candidatus Chloroploca asiatica]PDV98730.1 hypothetical protein A9Q02_01985 [Candidatus Chloroploca asiatica]
MLTTSSARPPLLTIYARGGNDAAARLEDEARRLDAALGPCLARCTEFPAPGGMPDLPARLFQLARREAELASWTGQIAHGFAMADTTLGGGRSLVETMHNGLRVLSHHYDQHGFDGALMLIAQTLWEQGADQPVFFGVDFTLGEIVATYEAIHWNWIGVRLLLLVTSLNLSLEWVGPAFPLLAPALTQFLALGLVHCGLETIFLATFGNGPRWAYEDVQETGDMLDLLHQGFWYESQAHLHPQLFLLIATQLDQLSLNLSRQLGKTIEARDETTAEYLIDAEEGVLNVSVTQAFQLSAGGVPEAHFHPLIADARFGDHCGISYWPYEQVRLERLNDATGDYRISFAGLDPHKPGAANNLTAVIQTSMNLTETNAYYLQVKARFLAALERIPPGSRLHLEGHSMGGGMCLLLRNDPEVRQRMQEAGIVCASLITLGMVRPNGPAGADKQPDEDDDPFAHTIERHYVDSDDVLALSVGAGHSGYENIIMLNNYSIDDPIQAHTSYEDIRKYQDLPYELQIAPYEVASISYRAYSDLLELAPLPAPAPPPPPGPGPRPTPVPFNLEASENLMPTPESFAWNVVVPTPIPVPVPTPVPPSPGPSR